MIIARRTKIIGLLLTVGLFVALHFARAQATADTGSAVMTDSNEDVSNLSDLAVELKALEMATPIAASNEPSVGNFYSAQHAPGSAEEWPPLPGNIFGLPVWPLDTNIFVIDDLGFRYNESSAKTSKTANNIGAEDDFVVPSPPGGGSDTNTYNPPILTDLMPDYGTNLFIVSLGMVSGNLTGVASNTLADVEYAVQTNSDLITTNWADDGQFILGSDATNWTQFILPPPPSTNNLFYRLQSWADSSGTGIPDWWWIKYFGQDTNVNPYADPTGDGYTLLQDFQNGWNPNVFQTPLAPSGVTSSYNPTSGVATVIWTPSQGDVTGYTIIDSAGNRYSAPASSNSITINVPDVPNFALGEQTVYDTFQVEADYGSGNSPESQATLMEPNALFSTLITGSSNAVYLTIAGLPPNAENLSLKMIDEFADDGGDYSHDLNHVIPVSEVTNGLFLLPPSWAFPQSDGEGNTVFYFSLQCTDSDGSVTAAIQVDNEWNYVSTSPSTVGNWPPPFLDGREQLKQNLEFQFRVADNTSPFGLITYTDDPLYGISPETTSVTPTNYVYSAFYDDDNYNGIYGSPYFDLPLLNIYRPFEDNELYRNFVYSSSDMNTNGNIATGVEFPQIDYPDGAHLGLVIPPEYQPTTNVIGISPLLGDAQWLCTYPESLADNTGLEGMSYSVNYNGQYWTTSLYLSNNAVNYWGLQFTNVLAWYEDTNNNYFNTTINDGNTYTTTAGPTAFFMGTTAPQFATTEYDFWAGGWAGSEYALYQNPVLPGQSTFTPTNSINPIIVGVGNYTGISSFAKLEVTNGAYSGVYGYLQQYLDKAYKMDDEGNVTTNTTGVVSPYGSFFATTAGVAALETMPDPDNGQRGTGVVYCASLSVDKNHDGTMDLTFNGPDATSQTSPMEFWINNGNDGTGVGEAINAPQFPNSTGNVIQSMRELENFARLWICGMPAVDTTEGYHVSLSWANVSSGSPAIKLFLSLEPDGGIGYLTNTIVASNYVGNVLNASSFGTVSTGTNFFFPDLFFDNTTTKHLMFEGVTAGEGELVMTVTDSNSNTIAQTGVWLDLHDISDFYEFAVATNVTSGPPPSTLVSQFESIREVPAHQNESKQIVVFVHGINNTDFAVQDSAETVYKRLYWSGYRGRVAAFRWPCGYLPTENTWYPFAYNESEFWAYKSAAAFKDYLNYLKNRPDLAGYDVDILAHSQGNAVASEALSQGAPFSNYILTQGAVPAFCYDGTAPTLSALLAAEAITPTPFYASVGGYYESWTNISGNLIDFYNTNDFALATGTTLGLPTNWEENQRTQKPEAFAGGPSYIFYPSNQTSIAYFTFSSDYTVTDWQESRSMVARSHTAAVGAQGGLHGVIGSSVDLVGQFGFGNSRAEHSAEFTRPIQTTWEYYNEVMTSFGLQPTLLQ
jgi:hypothetical protein